MRRLPVYVAVVILAAAATLFGAPAVSALAAPGDPLCTVQEWRVPGNFRNCADRLQQEFQSRISCLDAPTPSAPDSGIAGWFATRTASSKESGVTGRFYSPYGYAGYDFTTYDLKCAAAITNPSAGFENTIASGELALATFIIGASNALREWAWEPSNAWGWADPLVDTATKAIFAKVFTPFGAVTLTVVGLYLLWRSRQANLSDAVTTAGWAVFVMVLITAIGTWPTRAGGLADHTLIGSLSVIHGAVGIPDQSVPREECVLYDFSPAACIDHRTPAVRASDAVVDGLLYQNWLRGTLGSAQSDTAQKYGPALYDAKSFSWNEIELIRSEEKRTRKEEETRIRDKKPGPPVQSVMRKIITEQKQRQWMQTAEQIKNEDPEAYQHLQGSNGMDRIGAGFLAILSALLFALFDVTASVLVLLGFLIFRWAVIAAPVLGTVGLLRPANAGLRRLGNAVIAAMFNIVIFGAGSAIYLAAVNLILTTPTLAPWLQVLLIWLTGVVGWLLLRPHRRITQLGGNDSTKAIASVGNWHRQFLRDLRKAATLTSPDAGDAATPDPTQRPSAGARVRRRPESRAEDAPVTSGPDDARPEQGRDVRTSPQRRAPDWDEPDVPDVLPPSYAVYRPDSSRSSTAGTAKQRPESVSVPD